MTCDHRSKSGYRDGRPLLRVALAVVALTGATRLAGAQEAPTAPSYVVVSSGLTSDQAARLGAALHATADGLMPDGAYEYVDPARFMMVPTVPVPPLAGSENNEDLEPVTSEGIDFAGVRALQAPTRLGTVFMVRQALRAAGITLPGGMAHSSMSHFDLFYSFGLRYMHQPIATNVSYSFVTPDGTPLEGPGAKAEFAFDSSGLANMAVLATRQLARGPDVPVLSHDEALALCASGFPPGATVTADLVHYAPPLSIQAAMILPHYRCGGTAPLESGGTATLKTHYLPATRPGDPFGPPTVFLTTRMTGDTVDAQADVAGGTPPYTFLWSSSSSSIAPASFGSSIDYDVIARDAVAAADETVHVTVLDGNGLSSSAIDSGSVVGPSLQPPLGPDPSSRTTGIEYQSWSAGLTGSEHTAAAFNTGTQAAFPTVTNKFDWAEYASWETDFRSNLVSGGHDDNWVDNVDMVYYSGHGYPGGFTFTASHVNKWIDAFPSLRLGDADMEWLALDTCLFLNNDDGKVLSRIKPMFQGLHIVVGFHTTAADSWDLGGIFTDDMFGTATNPNSHSNGAHLTVVQAWALAAIITNGPDGVWAAMGPFGPNGITDQNDRFWGFGAVGPDLRGLDIKGYWRVSGST